MVDFSQFLVWCYVFLLLLPSHEGKPQVIGPSQPIVAIDGEDIILPCRLEPPMNASGMVLEWARPDLSPGFVYVRRNSEEHVADRQPSYRGRTSVSVDKLELGDASTKLSKVTRSDEGTYRCHFPQLGQHALIRLDVGVVSTPVIEFVSNKSREVVLQCEAKGWYPEPEVFWLDAEGNLLSAGPTETVRGPDDLYTVSRRLTVRKSDNFICRVQQKNITQTRETHFYVPDHFFTVQSFSWLWIFINILCIVVLLVCASILIYIYINGVRCVKQMMLRMKERLEVKSDDVNKTVHELHPMMEGKKQQEEQREQQDSLQTEEASAAGDNSEEETRDNSKCSDSFEHGLKTSCSDQKQSGGGRKEQQRKSVLS